ncbi:MULTISPECIES: hypothetical protein [unclassified Lysinibacillus]|uniref:hypothetical protein n=1 Tax=unclassified Lysinibacillus TaxID=2636778 RepID=UPI003808E8F4
MVKYYYDKYNSKLSKTKLQTLYGMAEDSPLDAFKKIYPTINHSPDLYDTLQYDPYLNTKNKTSETLGQGRIYWLYEEPGRWGNKEYFFLFYDNVETRVLSVQLDNRSTCSFYLYGDNYASKDKLNYERGTLVETNIQAEDGTYPANGRHTDGFWYVKASMVNTAPTQPGAFTQPSGSLEIGDSKVFSVGASTDENGNLSKYIWEVSINGATYSKAGETTTNSFPYTIPTATSLKMRVKAVDTVGLESAYRESSQYTVTKPKYYYSKYSAVESLYPSYTAQSVIRFNPDGTGNRRVDSELINMGMDIKLDHSMYKTSISVIESQRRLSIEHDYRGLTLGYGLGYLLETYGPGEHYYFEVGYNPKFYSIYPTTNYECTLYEWIVASSYSRDSLIQSDIQAEDGTYPTNGRHTDGNWYVRGSRVSQSIAPPSPFTEPISGKKFKPGETANITFGASSAANVSLYEVDLRYNSTGTWSQLPYNNTLIRSWTITTNKSLKTIEFRVRAKNTSSVYSDYVYSEPFVIEHNVAPTVSLTSPTENVTLYENDILNIAGTAYDADSDQSVTVYYQINSEQRKVLATNISQTQIALSKQLKFKGSKLYDGDIVLTGILTDGVAQKLKVWATDSEGASSIIIEKSFYVVPNRAPLLSVDTVVPSGVVDNDSFKISGNATDHDENSTLKVTRRINSGNSVEIYSGTGGVWEFEVALAQLNIGENAIVVEVIDNYGAKTSKTIKLNKNEVKTPILQSVARYKIEPPKGTAKGVLLFIERDRELDLKVELSMTLAGEQEQYETLTPEGTAPMSYDDNIVEDTFYYETTEPKDKIVLKLSTTRPDATVNHKIHLISGAVE